MPATSAVRSGAAGPLPRAPTGPVGPTDGDGHPWLEPGTRRISRGDSPAELVTGHDLRQPVDGDAGGSGQVGGPAPRVHVVEKGVGGARRIRDRRAREPRGDVVLQAEDPARSRPVGRPVARHPAGAGRRELGSRRPSRNRRVEPVEGLRQLRRLERRPPVLPEEGRADGGEARRRRARCRAGRRRRARAAGRPSRRPRGSARRGRPRALPDRGRPRNRRREPSQPAPAAATTLPDGDTALTRVSELPTSIASRCSSLLTSRSPASSGAPAPPAATACRRWS